MNKLFLIVFILFLSLPSFAFERDYFVEKTIASNSYDKPYTNLDYNYESFYKIPIKLQITEKISTKKNQIYDGQKVNFKVVEDVYYKGKQIVTKGDIVTGRVETYTTRGMSGIPGTIIINNIDIPGLQQEKLKSRFTKRGVSLSLLVFPLKWALTFLPPTGSFTNIIIGGNAKLTSSDKITVYYYPDWGNKLPENIIESDNSEYAIMNYIN